MKDERRRSFEEGHGFVKKENEIKGYTQVLNFLDLHLKERTPEPAPQEQASSGRSAGPTR